MTADPEPPEQATSPGPECGSGFDDQRTHQALIGLRLTPAERLRWLESAMEGLRRVLGRARHGRPIESGPPRSESTTKP